MTDEGPIQSSKGRQRLSRVLRGCGHTVTPRDVSKILVTSQDRAAKILARWAKQGWLKRIARGIYAPISIEATQSSTVLGNPWVLVPAMFSPGYVAGWSAAEHWGLTEQIFQSVCVLSTRNLRRVEHQIENTTFLVRRIPEKSFFGLQTVWVSETKISVSDPHKTIVDMLDNPEVGGGIRHISSCLQSYFKSDGLDLSKLVSYADRIGNGAVFKRLGFLVSLYLSDNQQLALACSERMTQGLAELDPAIPGTRVVTRWRLRVPAQWSPDR